MRLELSKFRILIGLLCVSAFGATWALGGCTTGTQPPNNSAVSSQTVYMFQNNYEHTAVVQYPVERVATTVPHEKAIIQDRPCCDANGGGRSLEILLKIEKKIIAIQEHQAGCEQALATFSQVLDKMFLLQIQMATSKPQPEKNCPPVQVVITQDARCVPATQHGLATQSTPTTLQFEQTLQSLQKSVETISENSKHGFPTADLLQVISIALALSTIYWTVWNARKQAKMQVAFNHSSKEIDVILSATERYGKLIGKMQKPGAATKDEVVTFWSLQQEQFEYYTRGFVDDDTFFFWVETQGKLYKTLDPRTKQMTDEFFQIAEVDFRILYTVYAFVNPPRHDEMKQVARDMRTKYMTKRKKWLHELFKSHDGA